MKARVAPILLAASALLGGCGEGKGLSHIVVATEAAYPPMESKAADGTIVGFDPDLVRAICREEGLTVEFVDQVFDGILPGLSQGKYDAAISSLSITEERARQVDFTNPYFDAGQVVVVLAKNTGIRGPEDLEGRTISVQRNTTGHRAAEKVKGATVKGFDAIEPAFLELLAGRADAVINDEPPTRLYMRSHPEVRIAGKAFTEEKYGIAVRKGHDDLLAKLNEGLRKVKASGEYDRLFKQWIGDAGR